jgi:hypothetical protein
MGRVAPNLQRVEDWFYEALKDAGRGMTYGALWRKFCEVSGYKSRAAKTYLRLLTDGIASGRVKSVRFYSGPEGRLYGRTDEPKFAGAKEDAEAPPPQTRPAATVALPVPYHLTEVRSEWTNCPVTNRIKRTTILTVGLADFMECSVCHRVHFLGVNPKMKLERVYAWQIDPLACSEEYADALTTMFIGDPETYRSQPSSIDRIRKGGHYVGLMFRSSWDEDPKKLLARAIRAGRRTRGAPTRDAEGNAPPTTRK